MNNSTTNAEAIRADITAEADAARNRNVRESLRSAERWTAEAERIALRQIVPFHDSRPLRRPALRVRYVRHAVRRMFANDETWDTARGMLDGALARTTRASTDETTARDAMARIAYTVTKLDELRAAARIWLDIPFGDVAESYGEDCIAFWRMAHAAHAVVTVLAEQWAPVLLDAWYVCPMSAVALAESLRVRCLVATFGVRVAVRAANAERPRGTDVTGRTYGDILRRSDTTASAETGGHAGAALALSVLDDARNPLRIRRADTIHSGAIRIAVRVARTVQNMAEARPGLDTLRCAREVSETLDVVNTACVAFAGAVAYATEILDASTDTAADAVSVAWFASIALEANDSMIGGYQHARKAFARMELAARIL